MFNDDDDEPATHVAACYDTDEPPRELLCAWCRAQIEACERAAAAQARQLLH